MNGRRSFLGSVIGTIVGTKLPFRAVEAHVPDPTSQEKLARWQRYLRVYWLGEKQLMRFRSYLSVGIDGESVKIENTPISSVRLESSETDAKVTFSFVPWYPSKKMTVPGLGLIDDKNRFVKLFTFSKLYAVYPGDTFNSTITMSFGIPP